MRPKATSEACLTLDGQILKYRVILSRQARKLRIRIGPKGVEVISPRARNVDEIEGFVTRHQNWISTQLQRLESFRGIRRSQHHDIGQILLRGTPTSIRIEMTPRNKRRNTIRQEEAGIVIETGREPQTPAVRTLENWLRKLARREIEQQLAIVTRRLNKAPSNVYIMGQRTKWGNCSRMQNLSFNWKLIMAPEYVLRYLVTHEAVHLTVPDHSRKFWLTVQSLCPETERAKQWLSATGHRIQIDLHSVLHNGSQRHTT